MIYNRHVFHAFSPFSVTNGTNATFRWAKHNIDKTFRFVYFALGFLAVFNFEIDSIKIVDEFD